MRLQGLLRAFLGGVMTADEWRNRPMVTRTLEPCPNCKKFEVDVRERTTVGAWGHQFKAIACAKCAAEVAALIGSLT